MIASWKDVLGTHPQALHIYGLRGRILAANLANADTPNYKARDIDFKTALAQYSNSLLTTATLKATHANHIQPPAIWGRFEKLYRQPLQASLDGNTVESQVEQSEFTENAIHYQISLRFISSRFKSLLSAIKGE